MMRIAAVGGACLAVVFLLSAAVVETQSHPTMTSKTDFLRAMDELSNWGRWGDDDELGAANLITPETRKAAAALVTEGITVSLAHDVIQVEAIDASSILERTAYGITQERGFDRLAYTGSYTLLMEGMFNSTGVENYRFNIQPVTDDVAALTIGTRIDGRDVHGGRREVRITGNRQRDQRDKAEHNRDDGDHHREDRTFNEEETKHD